MSIAAPLLRGYLRVAEFWLNSSDPKKLACIVVGVNTIVLGAWKMKGWGGRMAKWWMHNPASGRQITLLTSTFRSVGHRRAELGCELWAERTRALTRMTRRLPSSLVIRSCGTTGSTWLPSGHSVSACHHVRDRLQI